MWKIKISKILVLSSDFCQSYNFYTVTNFFVFDFLTNVYREKLFSMVWTVCPPNMKTIGCLVQILEMKNQKICENFRRANAFWWPSLVAIWGGFASATRPDVIIFRSSYTAANKACPYFLYDGRWRKCCQWQRLFLPVTANSPSIDKPVFKALTQRAYANRKSCEINF